MVSLVERITQAREDAPGMFDEPWIATANGLLAECAQRLQADGIRELVAVLRRAAADPDHEGSYYCGPDVPVGSFAEHCGRAADLLEQVFLDPQETNQ